MTSLAIRLQDCHVVCLAKGTGKLPGNTWSSTELYTSIGTYVWKPRSAIYIIRKQINFGASLRKSPQVSARLRKAPQGSAKSPQSSARLRKVSASLRKAPRSLRKAPQVSASLRKSPQVSASFSALQNDFFESW